LVPWSFHARTSFTFVAACKFKFLWSTIKNDHKYNEGTHYR
jgi:hypothetical protein